VTLFGIPSSQGRREILPRWPCQVTHMHWEKLLMISIKDFGQSHSFSGHGGQFMVYHHSCGRATLILHTSVCGPSDYITILQCPQGLSAIMYSAITTTDKLLKDHVQLNHCSLSMLCKVYKQSNQSIPHSATLPQCIVCMCKKMKRQSD
jgi:hypothetical protein